MDLENNMDFNGPYVRIKIPPIQYKASDGKIFNDRKELKIHEDYLIQQRLLWYNKRFTIWNEFRHWLTGYEPPKPYKF